MKTVFGICIVLVTVASAVTAVPSTMLWDSSDNFGSFISPHCLFFGSFTDSDEGEYLYKSSDGKFIKLTNNIANINEFFKKEFTSQEAGDSFLKTYFVKFIVATMSDRSLTVLDRKSIANGWGSSNLADDLNDGGIKGKSEKQLKEELLHFVSDNAPVGHGNDWSLRLFLLNTTGGLEGWQINGTEMPFRILGFKSTRVAKDHSFYGYMTNQ